MNEPKAPCQFLDWDTGFFGHRIARVNGTRLDPVFLKAVLDWCQVQEIECLYFLAESNDPQTVWLAQDHDFSLVEIRITLERSLLDWNPDTRPRAAEEGVIIRHVEPADIPVLQDIASTSYVDSRYYFDRHFTEENWQSYYATWVKKSCSGGADLALAAVKDGEVIGYITGLVDKENNTGIYELTGVRDSARRSGVGQELFRSGLDWYARNGLPSIWVATQGRNVATQRMIQRHDFLTKSCQFYFHKWFKKYPHG
jgi:dTDP-4-amino-4,6-dideoxy-D-galactose acyltransferase